MNEHMGLPEFGTYGHYATFNGSGHCLYFELGPIRLYYSYKTVVAFYTTHSGLVISENLWGSTTGKHLNWINEDKSNRIPRKEFEASLEDTLHFYGLS